MPDLSFAQKIQLRNAGIGLVLVTAVNKAGHPFFCYLKANAEKIEEIAHAYQQGRSTNLLEGTRIILRGWGKPTPAMRRHMEEKYGFMHHDT